MRAVWLKELGGPEVLVAGDAPEPEVGPEQVLVDVAYAGITFVETQMRATGFGPFPLEQATVAHRLMESRTAIGKTLLVVDSDLGDGSR